MRYPDPQGSLAPAHRADAEFYLVMAGPGLGEKAVSSCIMKPRSARTRLGRVVRTVACVVAAGAVTITLVNVRWGFGWRVTDRFLVGFGVGEAWVVWQSDLPMLDPYGPGPLFAIDRRQNPRPFEWRPDFAWDNQVRAAKIPLWLVALAATAVAGGQWWLARRARLPGHCRCGYDLRGLPTGAVCPECGRDAGASAASPS